MHYILIALKGRKKPFYRRYTVAAVCFILLAPIVRQGIGAAPGPIRFRNSGVLDGFAFRLENSATPHKHLPETMAGGVAALDYDGDGLTDVFLTNGASMPGLSKDEPRYFNRLYRNQGNMHFRDVTSTAHLEGSGFSIGAAAADFDNDGHVDLFVAGVRRNLLYRNRGDGTFADITATSGITSGEWSVGAAWLDYDNDGLLDLFVVNYVQWTPTFDEFCGDRERNIRVYCHPRLFPGSANRLYRNLGGGRFEDVSARSGVAGFTGKGMAASVADYDSDGYPDIFVSNDKVPNFLFHNLRDGRFEEVALEAGVALPDAGTEMSSMGTEFRDMNNDRFPDVMVTALSGETFPLFLNRSGKFSDAGFSSRLAPLSRPYSGWGIGAYDSDNDGWKDVFTVNGHVSDRVEDFEATEYRQRNSIFRNVGAARFEDISAEAGEDFRSSIRAHRGCAFGDLNGDGRIDAITSSLGDRPEIWENTTETQNSWLIVRLRGTRSNRDGIGAIIHVGNQTNHMTTSVGYASSSHFGVHFGLGAAASIPLVEIRWPSGARQLLRDVKTNQVLYVTEPSQAR